MASTLNIKPMRDHVRPRGEGSRTPSPVMVVAPEEPELILHGLARLLAPFSSRVRLVTYDGWVRPRVDVALFDCFPDPGPALLSTGRVPESVEGVTVAYSWHTQPVLISWALEHGYAGYISKALPVSALVEALEAVHAGETVIRPGSPDRARSSPGPSMAVAGQRGLTPREAEALTLVCSGLSNAEIAQQMHISLNSLKSYIRSAYRRVDVTTRSQAVLWGIEHGFGRAAPPTSARPLGVRSSATGHG
jgi:DNA-binding NarL/FixJ family response regulator